MTDTQKDDGCCGCVGDVLAYILQGVWNYLVTFKI